MRHDPQVGLKKPTKMTLPLRSDSICSVPSNAANDNQAFSIGSAWGVQFHPEFDADIVRSYIRSRSDAIEREGGDPVQLIAKAHDSDVGPRLLRRFAQIVRS